MPVLSSMLPRGILYSAPSTLVTATAAASTAAPDINDFFCVVLTSTANFCNTYFPSISRWKAANFSKFSAIFSSR